MGETDAIVYAILLLFVLIPVADVFITLHVGWLLWRNITIGEKRKEETFRFLVGVPTLLMFVFMLFLATLIVVLVDFKTPYPAHHFLRTFPFPSILDSVASYLAFIALGASAITACLLVLGLVVMLYQKIKNHTSNLPARLFIAGVHQIPLIIFCALISGLYGFITTDIYLH